MSYELRVAEQGDLASIMAIENAVFVRDAWSEASMAHELANPSCRYLVVVDDAAAVVAYTGLLAPVGSPDSDIQTLAVRPEARRQGLARSLMQRMLAEARSRGARETFLEVRADNPSAQRLYESLGFVGIAVRPRYYQPDGVDAIVMRAALPPEAATDPGVPAGATAPAAETRGEA